MTVWMRRIIICLPTLSVLVYGYYWFFTVGQRADLNWWQELIMVVLDVPLMILFIAGAIGLFIGVSLLVGMILVGWPAMLLEKYKKPLFDFSDFTPTFDLCKYVAGFAKAYGLSHRQAMDAIVGYHKKNNEIGMAVSASARR